MLKIAFPRQPMGETAARLYGRMLADLGEVDVQRAVQVLICTSRYLPTIAEIREQVAEAALGLPSVAEAVGSLGDGSVFAATSHPLVRRACSEAIGTRYDWEHSKSQGILRSQYREHYRWLRAAALRSRQAPALSAGPAPRLEAPSEPAAKPTHPRGGPSADELAEFSRMARELVVRLGGGGGVSGGD